MKHEPCIIDGSAISTPEFLEVVNPSTGKILAYTARGAAAQVDQAVAAARASSDGWRRTSVTQRAAVLIRIASLIRRDTEKLALLESLDTGKPLTQARADVSVAARYFEYYASCVEALFGHSLPVRDGLISYTRHEPYGVTGHIIPWNYPLQIGCRTIAPSIAVGNCAVVKPAEDAPLSVIKLAQLALEAGLPPGVLNVVPGTGPEAGAALAAHPGIDHLSFTGSVPVGSLVAKAAADNVIPVALELGGKSPNIVFPDANLDLATPAIVAAMIQNAGQTCSAGSRLIVHDAVADELYERIGSHLRGLSVGAGPDDPDLGPLISAKQRRQVSAMVDNAIGADGRILGGSEEIPVPTAGFYFAPTMLVDVEPTSTIAQEEVFGPVLATMRFDSAQQALNIANGTDFGLIAAVWSRDVNIVHTFTEELRAGQVYVNTYGAGGGVEYTFGGYKKSGYGREKGFDALAEFCQTKSIVLKVCS